MSPGVCVDSLPQRSLGSWKLEKPLEERKPPRVWGIFYNILIFCSSQNNSCGLRNDPSNGILLRNLDEFQILRTVTYFLKKYGVDFRISKCIFLSLVLVDGCNSDTHN